jgi:nucleotide-binding universal stress UspA family protein
MIGNGEKEADMYSKILVPYDNSEHAQHALLAAIDMATCVENSTVTVLNVTDLIEFDDETFEVAARMAGVPRMSEDAARVARENYYSEHEKSVRKSISEVVSDVPTGISLEVKIDSGRPQEAICNAAVDGGFDCIVMGRRGLGAIRGALGSVSYAVLRSVELPVLIVK